MTVNVQTPWIFYQADGVQTIFPYDFSLKQASDLFVYWQDSLVPPGGYTVTGVGQPTGGTVVFAQPLPRGEVMLRRGTPQNQLTDYVEGDAFPAESHEGGLDRLTVLVQDLNERFARASLLGVTTDTRWRHLTLPDPVGETVLGWDQQGLQWTLYPRSPAGLPPDPVYGWMLGPFVRGTSGEVTVTGGMTLEVGPYEALLADGSYVEEERYSGLLSGPDGLYWVGLSRDTTTVYPDWTRIASSHVLWRQSATVPAVPTSLLLVATVTASGGTLTQPTDCAPHRVAEACTLPASRTTTGPWLVFPGGSISVASGATWTCNGLVQAPGVPGLLPGPGTVKFGPQQASNAVWFCTSGTGLHADPWVSADGSGGFIAACQAVQAFGTLRPTPGWYRFTSPTPAQFDLPVNSSLGQIVCDMRGVTIRVETTGTVFKLNKNGVLASTATNLNTLHWQGGYFTTQTPGVIEAEVLIRGLGIDCTRCRNVSIRDVKFVGLQTAIQANVADTLLVMTCFFRRCFRGLYWPEIGQPDISQDIVITSNTASLIDYLGDMTGCAFLEAQAATGHLAIRANGIACNATNARFVKLTTGGGSNASRDVVIDSNATEQFSTGSKLIEIVRSGTLNYRNVTIRNNQLSSPFYVAPGPPYAQGQPLVDLSYCEGVVLFEANECTNTSVTAFKCDNLRNDSDGIAGLCLLRGNRLTQLSPSGGTLFAITNTIGTGTRIEIERNSTAPFYGGTLGAMVYPADRTRFVTTTTYTSAVASATSITIAPWDNAVNVNGTTPVTTITPTWKGHTVEITLTTALGRLVTDTGNLRLQGDLVARSTVLPSKITLVCDGTLWTELSRFNQQLAETVASATTITINSFSSYVGLSGTAVIQTINGGKNGQVTTFRLQEAATLKDAVGNLQLAGDIVGNSSGGVLVQLVFDSTTWRQTGPVVTVQP